MVIDLQRCVGCGACAFACKAENNTRNRADGQSFNWADFVMKTEGTFPNIDALGDAGAVQPLLGRALHQDVPATEKARQAYKAMFKTPEGITMHDPELCIGCRDCQQRVPVQPRANSAPSSLDGETYSVISFNPDGENDAAAAGRTRPRRSPAARPRAPRSRPAAGAHAAGAQRIRRAATCSRVRTRRRGREVHLLLPPHQQRPAAGLRRGLPVEGAHLRRPGRPERRDRQDAEGAEVLPPAGRTRARSRTCTTSASTAPRPDRARCGTSTGAGVTRPLFVSRTAMPTGQDLGPARARETSAAFWRRATTSPAPEFAEEKLFDSMLGRASSIDPDWPSTRAAWARRSRRQDLETCWSTTRGCSWARSTPLARPYGSVWLGRGPADAGLDDAACWRSTRRAASTSPRISANCRTMSRRTRVPLPAALPREPGAPRRRW